MGAKKILSTRDRNPLNVQSPETTLSLGAGQYTLWQSGIEFHSPKPLALWGEMVVEVTTVADQKKINANGIVVECRGNRHSGYAVTMVFMNLTKQAQGELSHLLQPKQQPRVQL
ncbi:hypothetical protein LBMAG56_40090 [Verrucomicrobiota bacterium]|nr:hypothetical protein LBMAG56_40090 [Verrucomicrobiota bacterium]